MTDSTVFQQIARHGIVPVIAIDNPDAAIPLADALIAGGLPIAEITFRTKAAAAVIEKISTERPQVILGAGTVLSEDNVRAAADCGARFAVAPGLNPKVVEYAFESGLPFAPGIATPSDIEAALSLGCTVLKFFPAQALGGPAMIKALSAPYAHLGVRFVPTGGVNENNLADYLTLPSVPAVGGTWLAQKEDLVQGAWDQIQVRCKKAVAQVAALREK